MIIYYIDSNIFNFNFLKKKGIHEEKAPKVN